MAEGHKTRQPRSNGPLPADDDLQTRFFLGDLLAHVLAADDAPDEIALQVQPHALAGGQRVRLPVHGQGEVLAGLIPEDNRTAVPGRPGAAAVSDVVGVVEGPARPPALDPDPRPRDASVGLR